MNAASVSNLKIFCAFRWSLIDVLIFSSSSFPMGFVSNKPNSSCIRPSRSVCLKQFVAL